MSERIDICNLALEMLGQEPITSIEDDSPRARTMKAVYSLARDATLEAHEWSFARKQFVPGLDATPPAFGYGNRFKIPADVIRVTRVDYRLDAYGTDPGEQAQWEVVGQHIHADWEAIYCEGIRSMDDEGGYSSLFVMAFAAHLAMLAAYALTASRAREETCSQRYAGYLQQAKSRDAMQGRNKRIRSREMQKGRHIGTGRHG